MPKVSHGELVVVAGPCRGVRIPVSQDVMRIGREHTCEIHLDDEAASRVHSEIVNRGGKIFLRDLKSTNGTFHNDARIAEAQLQNGDRIGVGDSVLQYQLPQRTDKSAPQIVFSQDAKTQGVGVSLSLGDSRFLELKDGTSSSDVQKHFTQLYDFITDVSGILHRPALLDRALARLFDVFPAERGLILLMSPEGEPGLQVARMREGGTTEPGSIEISHTMLQLLLQKKESFLSQDPQRDERLAGAESVMRSPACSIIAAPLKIRDKIGGIVYLDTANFEAPFTETHLRLCTAMALQLAVSLENTRLYTELLSAAEFNNSVLSGLGSGILVLGLDGTVLHMNRAALDIVEKSESQMLGHIISEFPAMSDFELAWQNTLSKGKPEERYELNYKTSGGSVVLGLSSTLLTDHAGAVTGVILNFRNLGTVRKLEEQARRAHYLEALGQLAAGVAHEIRNPLNSIRGFTQLIHDNLNDHATSAEYIKIVLEEVDRMNNIVQDMLDFSRQRTLTLLPISVLKLLEDLVRDMQVEARQANVSLEILEPGEELPNALGNNEKLRQVFRNIVLNAIQACKKGGNVTIGFQSVVSEIVDPNTRSLNNTVPRHEIAVHVNDAGCGMTAEVMRKIFDPFYTQKETGTGLGLSISQKIIEQHHGRIEVKSEVGRGSTFSVHLPAINV